MADIIAAVDEPIDATQCGGKENCHDDQRCMTHDLWATLNAKMYDYLSSVTLADLVAHQHGKHVAVLQDWRAAENVGSEARGGHRGLKDPTEDVAREIPDLPRLLRHDAGRSARGRRR